ncbi:AraC family transcriptional regulator [Cryptosporangium minutisporangium]|uniref:AraC family transcriptional regulator n=1 Tax=Cryptosporangium minutisporangium TaxID=113569 RepID=A0ABP6T310_9ACTN
MESPAWRAPVSWQASASPADAVSNLLDRLRWTAIGYSRDAIGPGAGRSFRGAETRFHHVVAGTVTIIGSAGPVRLGPNDAALALRGGDYAVRAETTAVVLSAALEEVGGPDLVADRLPLLLLNCGFATKEPLAAMLLDRMEAEVADARPGAASVVSQLANVVAATALRAWVENGCDVEGWHRAAGDPDIARVTAAVRDDPGQPWTVDRLARVAHASRSMFAERFRLVVGESPGRYVLRIRMERAKQLLRRDGWSVARTAVALGYGSEAAFSRAFRRFVGVPPSAWRQTSRPAADGPGLPPVVGAGAGADVTSGAAPRG